MATKADYMQAGFLCKYRSTKYNSVKGSPGGRGKREGPKVNENERERARKAL